MKKIIFLILVLFMFIVDIEASSKFYVGEKIEDVYIEYRKGERRFNDEKAP